MEAEKSKKKGLILKTWERCKSIGRGSIRSPPTPTPSLGRKSKSWHGVRSSDEVSPVRNRRASSSPVGCFPVYVGPERRKFLVKTEHASHPLFRVLLEEAESEYGFSRGGPIELPCEVDLFYRVLVEMNSDDRLGRKRVSCGFGQGYVVAYRLLSPSSRLMSINQY